MLFLKNRSRLPLNANVREYRVRMVLVQAITRACVLGEVAGSIRKRARALGEFLANFNQPSEPKTVSFQVRPCAGLARPNRATW